MAQDADDIPETAVALAAGEPVLGPVPDHIPSDYVLVQFYRRAGDGG